jgi:catechol 2,3-dioxygenase-like lactoylglutathione lyase family enzyme
MEGMMMTQEFISGIQQIGIGVKNADASLRRYATLFGMKALVFNDISEAALMTQYTGGQVYKRHALLSLNMQGGGGFEIWQFQNREPAEPSQRLQYGDIGIYAAKLKSADVKQAFQQLSSLKNLFVTPLQRDAKGDMHFFVADEHNNHFNIVTGNHWFQRNGNPVGGVTGAVIGVSDMERSISFYKCLLTGSRIVYDTVVAENGQRYRKILLQKHACGRGAFGKFLGAVEIELVQCLDRQPSKIFANRFWGDCGFIHLCFDVFDMCGLKIHAENAGYKFTVDSMSSFEMESASGRFCYIEDPDGTLIELVETHKVPIFKKFGLYLDLKKRDFKKPLPDWMIKLLALSKVKEK